MNLEQPKKMLASAELACELAQEQHQQGREKAAIEALTQSNGIVIGVLFRLIAKLEASKGGKAGDV
jgi:hypothetical protein